MDWRLVLEPEVTVSVKLCRPSGSCTVVRQVFFANFFVAIRWMTFPPR